MRDYRYPLQQRASTLWYHDHTMDFTGPNVYRGLAGFFIVGDDQDDALPLPRGDHDLPLMICDRCVRRGRFVSTTRRCPADQDSPGVQTRYMAGVLGDVVLVNGVPWPRHEVDGTRYRLRLLNASNARRYEFALDPPPPTGSPFVQIASDGGLLAAPVARDSVTLASAERAEVVVDFGAYPVGTAVTLVNRLGTGSTVPVMRFDDRPGRRRRPRPIAAGPLGDRTAGPSRRRSVHQDLRVPAAAGVDGRIAEESAATITALRRRRPRRRRRSR